MLGERGRENARRTRVWQDRLNARRFEEKAGRCYRTVQSISWLEVYSETHDVYLKQERRYEEMYRTALFSTGTSCFSGTSLTKPDFYWLV